MKSLSQKEAIAILSDMKIDIPVPKAAVTQRKRNVALDMAISALSCSEMPNSSDSISRQMAIDALDKRFDSIPMEQTAEILQLRKDLRELPSEQPEIIRCRDCKLRDTEYCNMAHGFMGMKDDDFCSYGERREVSE